MPHSSDERQDLHVLFFKSVRVAMDERKAVRERKDVHAQWFYSNANLGRLSYLYFIDELSLLVSAHLLKLLSGIVN